MKRNFPTQCDRLVHKVTIYFVLFFLKNCEIYAVQLLGEVMYLLAKYSTGYFFQMKERRRDFDTARNAAPCYMMEEVKPAIEENARLTLF